MHDTLIPFKEVNIVEERNEQVVEEVKRSAS